MSNQIEFAGFTKVLIRASGEAVSYDRARAIGVDPDIGFMRKDGWSLGAPESLADIAKEMWRSEWTHEIKRGERFWRPI